MFYWPPAIRAVLPGMQNGKCPSVSHHPQGGAPPVISWLKNHSKYRYNPLINPSEMGLICANLTNELGHHLATIGIISSPADICFGDVKQIFNSRDINPNPCLMTAGHWNIAILGLHGKVTP